MAYNHNDFHWNKRCHWNSIYSLLLSQYLKNMKRILKIWRYCTIGVIISLLGITIILMGCSTNTNLKKGVNKSIMNEPIVTYWWDHSFIPIWGFRLLIICHGNPTYKRLNTKIIEGVDFYDWQFNRKYDLSASI